MLCNGCYGKCVQYICDSLGNVVAVLPCEECKSQGVVHCCEGHQPCVEDLVAKQTPNLRLSA